MANHHRTKTKTSGERDMMASSAVVNMVEPSQDSTKVIREETTTDHSRSSTMDKHTWEQRTERKMETTTSTVVS